MQQKWRNCLLISFTKLFHKEFRRFRKCLLYNIKWTFLRHRGILISKLQVEQLFRGDSKQFHNTPDCSKITATWISSCIKPPLFTIGLDQLLSHPKGSLYFLRNVWSGTDGAFMRLQHLISDCRSLRSVAFQNNAGLITHNWTSVNTVFLEKTIRFRLNGNVFKRLPGY